MHQGPEERSSDPPGDCPGLARGCPGVSGRGMGPAWPAARLGALSVAVHAWDLLKEATIVFVTSTVVWAQVNSRVTIISQMTITSTAVGRNPSEEME